VTLGAGSYFFAIQAVTPTFGTYLQQGLVTSGAAETHDGGATWSVGYENEPSGEELGGISVALYNSPPSPPAPVTPNSVPEADGWVMMLVGVGVLGASLRVRRSVVADSP
jgi:hypothetical protein